MTVMGSEPMDAVNGFVNEQRDGRDASTHGNVAISLYTFNTATHLVWDDVKLPDVVPFTDYVPCGMTALYDAIHRVVNDLNHLPVDIKKNIVIITDGRNNSGNRTLAETKRLIDEKTALGWTFTYIGANQNAFVESQALGINVSANFAQRPDCNQFHASLPCVMRSISSQMTPSREPQPPQSPTDEPIAKRLRVRAR